MPRVSATLRLPAIETERELSLRDVLDRRLIRPAFQPLVDLHGGAVLGYEALARGPVGTEMARPDQLFGAAHAEGMVGELDMHCRVAAFSEAGAAHLSGGLALFVNLEPAAIGAPCPAGLSVAGARPPSGRRVIIEITERALTADSAALLRAVAAMREQGYGIALDDVGADSRSLALMPFLRPDVIKLDLRLVQARPSVEVARILSAVNAQAERTGATVVAEGIETSEHLDTARALGATVGQGWLFGHPGALPGRAPVPEPGLRVLAGSPHAAGRTPYEIIQSGREVTRGTKPLLRAISRKLELDALALGDDAVVLSAFQDVRYFHDGVRASYEEMSDRMAFAGVLASGMPGTPGQRLRGGHLPEGDPLRAEWDVAVIGPHFAAALAARDLGDDVAEDERRFDYAMTHNRDLAIEAARSMMLRVGVATP